MGLPEINISFSSLAVSAIQRSQRGIVALILVDDTSSFETKEYRSITEVDKEDFTDENYDYISMAFKGTPSKVIVERIGAEAEYSVALQRLKSKKWNYLAVPSATNTTLIASFIKEQRDSENKTFKAVLANVVVADHEGVINFTTTGIKVGEKAYTAAEFTARIAGVLAGLSLQRSATYFVLPEVDSIVEHDDPNAAINNGELILINDGEKIKIGRGVNSLTSFTVTKSSDFSKIKIIEGHDLVKEDIARTFNDHYVGKVNNSYDNQVLFLASVNSYLSSIEGDVLDPNADNIVGVDVEAQRLAWKGIGTDTSDWDDQRVRESAFRSSVFVGGKLKFLDATEDLHFKIQV